MEHQAIFVSSNKSLLQIETICGFLKRSSWASKRSEEKIVKSIENSLCFGAYVNGRQVGFARVVTDSCTFAYLCDVFVDEGYRGKGVSKKIVETILKDESLQGLKRFCLLTEDAHGLYKQYGFKNVAADRYMEIVVED